MADPIIRGRRLDETKPGSGLGHSIVADLAHSYSGKLELARSELGGLSAKLTLPAPLDRPYNSGLDGRKSRISAPNRAKVRGQRGKVRAARCSRLRGDGRLP